MNSIVTDIVRNGNDTVSFYNGTTLVKTMSRIMPSSPNFFSYRYDTITIQSTKDDTFSFQVYPIVNVETVAYTALNFNSTPEDVETKTKAIYTQLTTLIFDSCCDCSGGSGGSGSCPFLFELEVQNATPPFSPGPGQFYANVSSAPYDFAISNLTYNSVQDIGNLYPAISVGSWIYFYNVQDASNFRILQVDSYDSSISPNGAFNTTTIASAGRFDTYGSKFCFTFTAGAGVSNQNWQQTLDQSTSLDKSNLIKAGGFDFAWENLNDYYLPVNNVVEVGNWDTNLVNPNRFEFYADSGRAKILATDGSTELNITVQTTGIKINTPDVVNSTAVAGYVLKLQADGTAEFEDATAGTGTVQSVGLSMPSAFSLNGTSPITTIGTFNVTAVGDSTEFIDGTGALQTLPVYIAESGLNNLTSPLSFRLGGTLLENAIIDTDGNYVSIDGPIGQNGTPPFAVSNLGPAGLANFYNYAQSTRNPVVISNETTNTLAPLLLRNSFDSATNRTLLLLEHGGLSTNPTAASISIDYELNAGIVTPQAAKLTAAIHTLATAPNYRSLFNIETAWSAAGVSPVISVLSTGQIKFNAYVPSAFQGVAQSLLGVNSLGEIVTTGTGGFIVSVSGIAPIQVSAGINPVISMPAASPVQNGYLSSTAYNTFNNKQDQITLTTIGTTGAATFVGNVLNIPQYSAATVQAGSGLSQAVNVISLGYPTLTAANASPLTQSSFINVGSFDYTVIGSQSQEIMLVKNTRTNTNIGHGLRAEVDGGNAIEASQNFTGTITNQYIGQTSAVEASSNVGRAYLGNSQRFTTAYFELFNSIPIAYPTLHVVKDDRQKTSTYDEIIRVERQGPGAANAGPQAGFGAVISYRLRYAYSPSTAVAGAGSEGFAWIDPTVQTSEFIVAPTLAGVENIRLKVKGNGQMRLPSYTSTAAFPGIAQGVLGFDNQGNIITVTGSGGGGSLASLSDVQLGALSNGQVLQYNSSSSKWENASVGVLSDGNKGDITVSSGAIVWVINNGVVTYSKIQNVAANSFLANTTGSSASVQEISTSRIPLFSSAISGTPSATTFLRGDGSWATPSGGGGTLASLTDVQLGPLSNGQVLQYNSTSSKWENATIGALTDGDKGDITVSGSGTVWTIDSQAVTYSKIQNVAANSFLANTTGSATTVQEIATNRIPLFSSSISGTPSSTTFLRGDGSWQTVPGITDGDRGDITVSGSGATWTIDNGVVTYAKLQAPSAGSKILGSAESATAYGELNVANGLSILGSDVILGGTLTNPTQIDMAGNDLYLINNTATLDSLFRLQDTSPQTVGKFSARIETDENQGFQVLTNGEFPTAAAGYAAQIVGTKASGLLVSASASTAGFENYALRVTSNLSDALFAFPSLYSTAYFYKVEKRANSQAGAAESICNYLSLDPSSTSYVNQGFEHTFRIDQLGNDTGVSGSKIGSIRVLTTSRAGTNNWAARMQLLTAYTGASSTQSRVALELGSTGQIKLPAYLNSTSFVGTATAGLAVDASGNVITVAAGGGVTDGDKGDITVSSGGTVWTIDNGVVTYAKMQDVAANSFLANTTGSAASVQEIATNRIPLFASAITGTPSATTFLRGDGSWATPTASAVWGSITGTLSAQTDLQTALDAKMDESVYDPTLSGIVNSARKEMLAFINKTGATLTKGTIVYLKSSSASGDYPEVLKADATTEATSSKTVGAVYEDVANDGTGYVVTSGEVSNLDTSAYSTGQQLFLGTTPGTVVTTPPAEPNHVVFIGTVTRSQNTNGRILYHIQNGYELNELHGVSVPSPSANDYFYYNGTSQLWESRQLSSDPTISGKADLVSPAFTGTPTAPTASSGTNTTQIATTAFVQSEANSYAAYSIKANNTAATAAPTNITYKDFGDQDYSSFVTWATAPVGGASNYRYRWVQIGNMVNFYFVYTSTATTGGAGATTITIPTDMPAPASPTGFNVASYVLMRYVGITSTIAGGVGTSGVTFNVNTQWILRRNAGNTAYEFATLGTSITNARHFTFSGTYFI